MENASKALIIAGAILLSILIIALGMNVYNSASSSAEGANLSEQEVAAFNSKFQSYEGRQKGKVVRTLITAIQKSNADDPDKEIDMSSSTVKTQADITSNTKTYYVTFTYDEDSGLINTCSISDQAP